MLTHPTLDKLTALKLTGMAKGLSEQMTSPRLVAELSFEERLGLLVDREMTERDDRKLAMRLRLAQLREQACLEDLDFRASRGLDRSLIQTLSTSQWVRSAYNVFITGPTGSGKTYLACALGQSACRNGYDTQYVRVPRLLQEIATARGDGRYKKVLAMVARKHLLILDDWGLSPLTDEQRRDLLEIVEDRHGRVSTIVVSQVPVEKWHGLIGDPTLADAILDRIVHQAYPIKLKGESMRKRRLTGEESDRLG